PFGDGPRLEDAVFLEAKVVMEARRGMLLHDEARSGRGRLAALDSLRALRARGLRSRLEPAYLPVFREPGLLRRARPPHEAKRRATHAPFSTSRISARRVRDGRRCPCQPC